MKRFMLAGIALVTSLFFVGCKEDQITASYIPANADIVAYTTWLPNGAPAAEKAWEQAFTAEGMGDLFNNQAQLAMLEKEKPELMAVLKALFGLDTEKKTVEATALLYAFVLPQSSQDESFAFIATIEYPNVRGDILETAVKAALAKELPPNTVELQKQGDWWTLVEVNPTVPSATIPEVGYRLAPAGVMIAVGMKTDVFAMVDAMLAGTAPVLPPKSPLLKALDEDFEDAASGARIVVKDVAALIQRLAPANQLLPPDMAVAMKIHEITATVTSDKDDGDIDLDITARMEDESFATENRDMLRGFKAMGVRAAQQNPQAALYLPLLQAIEVESDDDELELSVEVTPAMGAKLFKQMLPMMNVPGALPF